MTEIGVTRATREKKRQTVVPIVSVLAMSTRR